MCNVLTIEIMLENLITPLPFLCCPYSSQVDFITDLASHIFQNLCCIFGKPDTDLLASQLNK